MAEQTEGTIHIEADPEDVLEVITDFDAYPEWADVLRAEVLEEDEEGRPVAVAFSVEQMGFEASYTLVYTHEPSRLSWTTREAEGALRDVRGEYVLEAEGDGTRVTYRLAAELAVPVPSLLRRQGERRVVQAALEGLKRRVEEG